MGAMTKPAIVTVVGARPQFIKAAAMSLALRRQDRIREILVHTGQHHDANMSDVFFAELDLPEPAHNLDIHGGSHGAMTGRMLAAIEEVLLREQPAALLVYGDTNSTLAGTLAAAKLRIPVAHVEAGLRSFNRAMPEETNRVLTDHASTWLFCPTATAVMNLKREGIEQGVHAVGDIMYDVTLASIDVARRRSDILQRLDLRPGGYTVATVHRQENTDSAGQLRAVLEHLRAVARERPVVLPLHPRTRNAAARFELDLASLRVLDPLPYLDMTRLVAECHDVHTDSGGLQKEAYFHRRPCVTLRSETEWVETVECGWARLWSQPDYRPRRDIADYGDGHAAVRMAAILAEGLGA
jgi:UDP-GlcNAc3NAcA epimerase